MRRRGDEPSPFTLLTRIDSRAVDFLLHDHLARHVDLFGSWDRWSTPQAMQSDGRGVWRTTLPLTRAGVYEYKFRIDGHHWLDDPANPRKTWDGLNGFNSLLVLD
jgi:hypothetical protein